VQHSSPLVQHTTLVLVRSMLQAVAPLMAAVEQLAIALPTPAHVHLPVSQAHAPMTSTPASQGEAAGAGGGGVGSWASSLRRLRAAVRARLPDPSTLLALSAALLKCDAQEEADRRGGVERVGLASVAGRVGDRRLGLKGRDDAGVGEGNGEEKGRKRGRRVGEGADEDTVAVVDVEEWVVGEEGGEGRAAVVSATRPLLLDVLALYQRWLPEALADVHFEAVKLMTQVRWEALDASGGR